MFFPPARKLGRLWAAFLLIATVLILGSFALSIVALATLLRLQQDPAAFWQAPSKADSASQRLPTPPGIYLENGGIVMRIDPVTGVVRWAYRLNVAQAPNTQLTNADSIVSVANNTVYVEKPDGYVYALEASTGRLRWRVAIGERLDMARTSKAQSSGNRLYVPGRDRLYVLRITDGHVMRTIMTPALTAFTLSGDDLYTTSGASLQAYQLPAGTLRWSAGVNADEDFTQPRMLGDTLYSAAYSQNRHVSTLYALDVTTGQQLWHSQPEEGRISDVTPTNDALYAGAYMGYVYAYDSQNGRLLWQSASSGFVGKAPEVGDGALFFTGNAAVDQDKIARARSVLCLDARTGVTRWTYTPSSPVTVDSVSVRQGKIYIDRENGIDVLDERGSILLRARARGGAQYTAIEVIL
ncbi:hypothetical protein KSX_10460 [Ktedonospora formicarum]|uniref:Pyrrolo-quinoline quinone repeat domain-containing protein n=2 Tax=Ktedonospora formicarum TaxID=2778364 RepID=A0A8J3MQR2_9CHLR|nr:hypothetical protein KSX_10460 [Ktedonospora formicarum]